VDGDRASTTAEGAAMLRAAHLLVDDAPPILEDPLAVRFLGERYGALARDRQAMAGPVVRASRSTVTGRSRVTESLLAEAVVEGCGQYVILGAGFDTFAARRPDLADQLTVYEVDHPATQARKREVVARFPGGGPGGVRYVPVDFERQTLDAALAAAGWDAGAATFFSWLGVTMYLTDAATFATLRFVASAAPGSRIVFQYSVAEDLLSSSSVDIRRDAMAGMVRLAEPWINFYRPAELVARVAALGFRRVANLDAAVLNPRLYDGRTDGLRWPDSGALLVAAR
jgi:methyltransferase (TIGR00027 family)